MDDVVTLDSKHCATYHTGNIGIKKGNTLFIHTCHAVVCHDNKKGNRYKGRENGN